MSQSNAAPRCVPRFIASIIRFLGGHVPAARELPLAAATGKIEALREAIQHGADVDAADFDGWTALHRAALHNQAKAIGVLVEEGGANVNSQGKNNWTPLHIAARAGCLEAVVALLEFGATQTAGKFFGVPQWTLYQKHSDIATRVEQPLSPRTTWEYADKADCRPRPPPATHHLWFTALDMASYRGYVEIIRALIRHGADVNASNIEGWTALHSAAINNQGVAISVLLEAGCDVEAEYHIIAGGTPLKCAVLSVHPDATLALLRHGARVNHPQVANRTDNGDSLLHAAAQKANREGAAGIVDLLLRFGADETAVNNQGRTAAWQATAKYMGVGADNISLRYRENYSRVILLLAGAPREKTWRRRGMLVMYRAHLARLRLRQEIMNQEEASRRDVSSGNVMEEETLLPGTLDRSDGVGIEGGNTRHQAMLVDNVVGLTRAEKWVIQVQAEELFRMIVMYV